MTASTAKQRAYEYGLWAESYAITTLMLKGYHLIARRMRNAYGEIDLIMQRGNRVCFIEVKARKTIDDALYALSLRQQQRLSNAANLWLAENPKYSQHDCRFDLIVVAGWTCHHLPHIIEGQ